jgi:hypothetical protein
MSEEHRKPSFSSTDAVEIAEYPRISRLAIVALLLGILSAAALASQLMWCLPAAGAIVAVAALQSIARAKENTIGRRAAVIGLALSLVFAAWAPLRYYVRQQILSRQARVYAAQWLTTVQQGRLREAHQLKLAKSERQRPDADLREYYERDQIMGEEFQEFAKEPCIRKIVELGDQVRPRYLRDESIAGESTYRSKLDVVTQLFDLEPKEAGAAETLPVSIQMVRARQLGESEDVWYVRNVEDTRERKE